MYCCATWDHAALATQCAQKLSLRMVSERKDCRVMPLSWAAYGCGGCAWQVPTDTIAADVEDVRDRALRYSLENGVAFLHKTLSAPDQAAVRRLFASGAIQVRG